MRPFALLAASLVLEPASALANGYGESAPWQFESSAQRAVNAGVLDLIEKKRGGYYDSFKSTNYNITNTYIRQQTNCSVSSSAAGNEGSNSLSASTSSPTISNGATTSAGTTGNGASNAVEGFGTGGGMAGAGIAGSGFAGGGTSGAGGWGTGSSGRVQTAQSNLGSNLSSGVSGSMTGASSGAVGANGGRTEQALNSQQQNYGAQTSSVNGSTACSGVGPLN